MKTKEQWSCEHKRKSVSVLVYLLSSCQEQGWVQVWVLCHEQVRVQVSHWEQVWALHHVQALDHDCFNKVALLAYGINHCHNSVISTRLWEFNNEVDTNDVPAVLQDQEWLKFPNQDTCSYHPHVSMCGYCPTHFINPD